MSVMTQSRPAFPPSIAADDLGANTSRPDTFLWFAALAMTLGTVVLVEPAPIDLALMLVLTFAILLGRVSFADIHTYPGLIAIALTLTNIASIWNPIDFTRALWYLAVTVYLIISLFLFAGVVEQYGITAQRVLFNGYVVAGVISAVLGVGAYFQLIPGQNLLLVNGRPKGLFKDPNVFGPYLVPMALYAFSRLEQLGASWLQRLLWGSSGLMAMAGIFFSYSRACWTNFLCATAAYLGLGLLLASKGRQLKMRGLVVALVIAAMLLLLAAAVSIPAVYNMLQLRLGHKGLQGYDQLRFYTHDLAWQSAYDHPFGIGPGQSEAAFQYATHSTLLRVLSENGFLGAAAFIGLVFASLGRSLYVAVTAADDQWRTISLVVFASILGVVVNSAVIDSVHWRHLWFLLGLAWVSRRRAVEVEMGWGVRAAQPGGALAWQPWERGV